MRQAVLELADTKVFRNKRQILHVESLAIAAGEIVAVVGPNGAGKSTFLQMINLHLPYATGTLHLFGHDAAGTAKHNLRQRSSMVFQDTLLLDDTVFNNVALSLRFRGIAPQEIKHKVNKALTDFRCAHLTNRMARKLSGGEAQRVCLARALVYEPELLLLDEPFGALDSQTRNVLLAELRQVAIARGTTVILVSHNFNDVLYFAERAIVLQEGRVVQDDTPELILRRPVNAAIASLIEMDNIISCLVERQGNQQFIKLVNGTRFAWEGVIPDAVTACCLPGDALHVLNEELPNRENYPLVLEGIISQIVPGIGMYRVVVEAQGLPLIVRVSREQVGGKVVPGKQLKLAFNPKEVQLV